MNHATTCFPNGEGICLPVGHAGADACLAPGASPVSGSAGLTANVAQVRAAAAKFGIDPARFERYAVRRWGRKWYLHADEWRQALDEMERYRNDPEGFIDKINAYLHLEGRSF